MEINLKQEFEKRFISEGMTQEQIEGAYSVLDWHLTSPAVKSYWKEQFKLEQDEYTLKFINWLQENRHKHSVPDKTYSHANRQATTQELLLIFRDSNK